MIDFDHGVDPIWQGRVLLWMTAVCISESQPEELFDRWVDEAADGDDAYLIWALSTWKKVVALPVFELEALRHQTHHWLTQHGDSPPPFRRAPQAF